MKLCGSLILANGCTIVADNGNGDTDDSRCGVVTFISNMTETQRIAGEPAYSNKVLKGCCRYDDGLMAESVSSASVKVPALVTYGRNGGEARADMAKAMAEQWG